MDRGQTKKIKTVINGGRVNPGYNPFNETQINRNNWIVSSGSANGKGQRPYYPVFHQKSNRNNRFHGPNFKRNANFGNRYFGNNNKKAFNNRRHPNK